MIQQTVTTSVEETEAVGEAIAKTLINDASLPRFIALYGDLGVGKTAFVRGLARVMAPGAAVRSPTFALVNEYRAKPLSVFHFDMYRIESEDDLLSIGFEDYLGKGGFSLCEWSENITEFIPEDAIRVTILRTDGEDGRKITVVTAD